MLRFLIDTTRAFDVEDRGRSIEAEELEFFKRLANKLGVVPVEAVFAKAFRAASAAVKHAAHFVCFLFAFDALVLGTEENASTQF